MNYTEVEQPELVRGIKYWKNEHNKFNILMLHYTADPEKDPERLGKEWYEKEKEVTPRVVWEKEYEINFSTKSGELVFGEKFCDFRKDIHLIDSFDIKSQNIELIMSLDFGQRNPTAALIGAVDMSGTVYIVDEYYKPAIPSVSSKEMFEKFRHWIPGYRDGLSIDTKRELADNAFQIKVIDPTTSHKNKTKVIEGEEIEYSVIEDFYDNGWDFEKGKNDFDAGITRIREYMALDKDLNSKFYIFKDKCPHLVKELTNYRYKENTETTDKTNNEPEKPVKKNDHAVDSLRYMMMTRPNKPMVPKQKETMIQKDIRKMTAPKIINDIDI